MCVEIGNACDDGDASTFDDVIDELCNCVGQPIQQTVSFAISASSDDVEENESTGVIDASSTDLELIYEALNDKNQIIGLPQSINAGHFQYNGSLYFLRLPEESVSGNLTMELYKFDPDAI